MCHMHGQGRLPEGDVVRWSQVHKAKIGSERRSPVSVRAMHTMFCDGPDCLRWIGQEDTVRELRALARRMGWDQYGPKVGDFCAAHRAGDPKPACPADGAALVKDDIHAACPYCRKTWGLWVHAAEKYMPGTLAPALIREAQGEA